MPRLRIQLLAALLAGLLAGGRPLDAQQAGEARTYTVKQGDTLWSIAKALLGDPYLWPELYRLNVGAIADPHWIYPGSTLKVPGTISKDAAAAAVAAAAQPGAEEYVASGLRRPNERPTIFDPATRKQEVRTRESLILGARTTAVRPGDFIAAPFVWAPGGLTDLGRLEWTNESQGIDLTIENRPVQIGEDVIIRLPKGVTSKANDRLLVYRLGPALAGQGQIIVPTGIVKVVETTPNGRARAMLQQKYEDVFLGQPVTVLDTLVSRPNVFPEAVAFGLVSRVKWISGEPVIPTQGNFLILAAGAKDGLVAGDQVALLHDGGTDLDGRPVADQVMGVAQVTRVTPWGASAVLVKQTGPSIEAGMKVRVTAKMP
ncbi:MAG: LysM peptidoglycan-binding domain-containing protein [Gemmatimonadetes bacterium]|nr:LysM peptidoglycan-binding domain-containing protein [Gemmatimonadota bacterium]